MDLVRRGESKDCEFKASLRWSIKGNLVDEAVTDSALKTIAAFLNAEGGTLLLGVGDEGEIVGIEVDGFPNTDKFLLHLLNVVEAALGKSAAAKIDARVLRLRDRTVCAVHCQPSRTPVWARLLKMAPKGQERFFVRSGGASTMELEPSKVSDYQRHRGSGSRSKRLEALWQPVAKKSDPAPGAPA